jgi:hypothetical protein
MWCETNVHNNPSSLTEPYVVGLQPDIARNSTQNLGLHGWMAGSHVIKKL